MNITFYLRNEYDDDLGGDYLYSQELWCEAKGEKHQVFSVSNLSDCPEDAIIDRDLFSARDFIAAVKYGMRLAEAGYTSIDVVEVE